jgi:hypothetical protein
MMFRVQMADRRKWGVIANKIRLFLRRGPAGLLRLLENGLHLLFGRRKQPADAEWRRRRSNGAGYTDIRFRLFEHEGGTIPAGAVGRPGESNGDGAPRMGAPPASVSAPSAVTTMIHSRSVHAMALKIQTF